MACGGFQLADRRPALEGLFEADKEIIVFDDLNDLRSKAAYYLDNPEERKRIAEQGRQRVLRDHTYEKRMEEMLEVIAEKGLSKPLWPEEGEDVEGLIQESAGDPELGQYLSRFSGKGRITLSDITAEISSSEGEISKTEGIFMLMKEFVR
jgi:spore maturation protein CgeB